MDADLLCIAYVSLPTMTNATSLYMAMNLTCWLNNIASFDPIPWAKRHIGLKDKPPAHRAERHVFRQPNLDKLTNLTCLLQLNLDNASPYDPFVGMDWQPVTVILCKENGLFWRPFPQWVLKDVCDVQVACSILRVMHEKPVQPQVCLEQKMLDINTTCQDYVFKVNSITFADRICIRLQMVLIFMAIFQNPYLPLKTIFQDPYLPLGMGCWTFPTCFLQISKART